MKNRRASLCLASLLLMLLPLLNACTYTQAVSQTNIPADRKKVVQASVEKFIVLGFNFDNDFALQLTDKLKGACPGGEVRGVTTHDTRTLYFLAFFMKREVSAQGYCTTHRKSQASIEPEWSELASYREEIKR